MFKYLLISALFVTAFAAQANELAPSTAVVHYQYGMNLDIAQVVSQTEGQDMNGITPILLTYKDSHGIQQTVEYSNVSVGTSG
ncbi:MAG: DUF2790 domain-containing protein [Pseudomonas sp.]